VARRTRPKRASRRARGARLQASGLKAEDGKRFFLRSGAFSGARRRWLPRRGKAGELVRAEEQTVPTGNRALYRARRAADLTLDQLAADVGISQSQLSRFESGKRQPRAADLQKIAMRLNVPVASLYPDAEPADFAPMKGAPAAIEGVLAAALDETLLAAGLQPRNGVRDRCNDNPSRLRELGAKLT
jgi:transcriptional regulator with XRE-family HTH domain